MDTVAQAYLRYSLTEALTATEITELIKLIREALFEPSEVVVIDHKKELKQ